jgi:hypothetical protein
LEKSFFCPVLGFARALSATNTHAVSMFSARGRDDPAPSINPTGSNYRNANVVSDLRKKSDAASQRRVPACARTDFTPNSIEVSFPTEAPFAAISSAFR